MEPCPRKHTVFKLKFFKGDFDECITADKKSSSGTQKLLHQCNVDLRLASFPVSQLSQLFIPCSTARNEKLQKAGRESTAMDK